MPKSQFDTDRFRDIMPSQSPETVTQLRHNLEDDGCRDKLVLAEIKTLDGLHLVDGFTRYDLCEELGIGYGTTIKKFDCESDAILWMHDLQGGRRNWTQGQEAIVAERWRRKVEEEKSLLKKAEKPRVEPIPRRNGEAKEGASISDAAEKFEVSVAHVHAAGKVLDKGSVALIRAAETGEIPIRAAAKIAEFPKQKQAAAMRGEEPKEVPSEAVDDLGNPVPPDLIEAFASRQTFADILNMFTAISKVINPLGGDIQKNLQPKSGWEYFANERQEFLRAFEQARVFIRFNKPYALCPAKHGSGKCPHCRGLKYVTKQVFEHISKELRV